MNCPGPLLVEHWTVGGLSSPLGNASKTHERHILIKKGSLHYKSHTHTAQITWRCKHNEGSSNLDFMCCLRKLFRAGRTWLGWMRSELVSTAAAWSKVDVRMETLSAALLTFVCCCWYVKRKSANLGRSSSSTPRDWKRKQQVRLFRIFPPCCPTIHWLVVHVKQLLRNHSVFLWLWRV